MSNVQSSYWIENRPKHIKGGIKDTGQKATAIIQARDDGDLNQNNRPKDGDTGMYCENWAHVSH